MCAVHSQVERVRRADGLEVLGPSAGSEDFNSGLTLQPSHVADGLPGGCGLWATTWLSCGGAPQGFPTGFDGHGIPYGFRQTKSGCAVAQQHQTFTHTYTAKGMVGDRRATGWGSFLPKRKNIPVVLQGYSSSFCKAKWPQWIGILSLFP